MQKSVSSKKIIGTVIDRKYRVDSLIGDGGMGKVYLVKHAQLGKTFALKLMSFEEETGSNQIVRFKREARVLAKIDHPNIVMITDFGITEDLSPYIVMEYVEGITLRKLIDENTKLTEKDTISIAEQICSGIHAVHLDGIIHRDLKPENIMVRILPDNSITIRVVDFGIAKLLRSDRANNTLSTDIYNTGTIGGMALTGNDVPGTLRYMAYEQAMGEEVDARTDVYSICVIIYEMLTGVVPSIVSSKIEPLDILRPDVNPTLVKVVHKGLSELKENRQQTALDLKRELEFIRLNTIKKEVASQTGGPKFDQQKLFELLKKSSLPKFAVAANNTSLNDKTEQKSNIVVSLKKLYLVSIAILFLLIVSVSLLSFPQLKSYIFSTFDSKGTLTKNIKAVAPPMNVIRGGTFIMGSDKGDEYARPEHSVSVDPFKVCPTLVTNGQYSEFITQTGHAPPQHWLGTVPPQNILDKPVSYVSWNDALAYCNWLGSQTGNNFRLLSESEWEFLARNKATIGINDLMENNLEWTNSEFILYPDSRSKIPQWATTVRIFRGKSNESQNEPITYRFFQYENYTFTSLGFRVACNIN